MRWCRSRSTSRRSWRGPRHEKPSPHPLSDPLPRHVPLHGRPREREMKQVLFEEDGAFRVGTILAEAGTSLQVEAAHGKRSKVKAASVLLHFDGQPLAAFMSAAQKLAEDLDAQFLWEVSGGEEFGFDALAREYYGRAPSPQEATAVALTLHANPIHFYKRGKGRYQAAPEQN